MRSIMHFFMIIILGAALLYPSVLGLYFKHLPFQPENNHNDFNYTSEETESSVLDSLNDDSEISNNASDYRTDDKLIESTLNTLTSENLKTEDSNVTFNSSSSSSSESLTINATSTQSIPTEIILTEIFSNESNSTGQTKPNIESTSLGTSEGTIVSSTDDENEEKEGVVRGKPSSKEITSITTTLKPETIYQKALSLINDTYTLSILLPVTAGILFACTILITIATCNCLRRQCRRRKLRRKTLPNSVKNFRPSDRARLLAESSDEEF